MDSGAAESGPARDLWIEILAVSQEHTTITSGPARDLWIEMLIVAVRIALVLRRVPQGTCGLKSLLCLMISTPKTSGPARDLWIEIE